MKEQGPYQPSTIKESSAYTAIVVEDERILGDGDGPGECRNHAGGCPTLNTTAEQPILFEVEMDTYQDICGTIDCGITKGTGNQLANQDMFVTEGGG